MPRKAGKADKGIIALLAACFWPLPVASQGLDESVTQLSGSGSVFTGVTNTRTDRAGGSDTNTEASVGLSGDIGGQLESGARSLSLRYGGTLETERDTSPGQQADSSSITGASRFVHTDPANRFDFNLGHSVSSVRNNSGFVIDPSNYDTQNTLSAGAGMRFFPGDLTTLRLSGQAGKSFGSGSLDEKNSFTASGDLSRRLSERATGNITGSRSWSDDEGIDITIDKVQLGYQHRLENGLFSFGAGGSKADTEFSGQQTTTESEAVTGYANRLWQGQQSTTSVRYERELSDSATDLSLDIPDSIDFLPDSIRIRDLVISDSVFVSHNTSQICSACDLGLAFDAAILESEFTGATTHEYTGSLNLGIQVTNLQRLNFGYSWQGDAGEDPDIIVDQIHRFNTSWTRQLAEQTSVSVQFNQSYLRSRLARSDQEQFTLRLLFTRGFSLTGRRQ